MRRLFALTAIAAVLVLRAPAAAAREPITVSFEGSTVKAVGVTPGAAVVFYGVGTVRIDYGNYQMRFTKVVNDDDHDGAVSYDLGRPIPPNSIWMVADSLNRDVAVAEPRRESEVTSTREQSFGKSDKNAGDTYTCACRSIEMLYVEPGRGVWLMSAFDGTLSDRDPRELHTAVSLDDAIPLLKLTGDKPKEFAVGAGLASLDTTRREIVARHAVRDAIRGDR